MATEFVANAGSIQPRRSNRRGIQRFEVDENATLLLVNHGSRLPCRVLDISLGGCRIYANERFQGGILVRVEVSFKVRGLAFRFSGVTQWTDSRHMLGVKFVDVLHRRKEELAQALAEVEAMNAEKAEKLAAEKRAAQELLPVEQALQEQTPESPYSAVESTSAEATVDPLAILQQQEAKTPPPTAGLASRTPSESTERSSMLPVDVFAAPQWSVESGVIPVRGKLPMPSPQTPPATPRLSNSAGRDRRAQARQGVDTTAVIFLVKIAAKLPGRILDLSLGGCRIRTDDRFPVGIYIRVETEFHLEGLPFRLAGVVQAIHDRHNVGIRFLDMSPRKKEQVAQLIAEIEEMHRHQKNDGFFPNELVE